MVSLWLSLICLTACFSSGVQAFGVLHSRAVISSSRQGASLTRPSSSSPNSGRTLGKRGRSVVMQLNPKEDSDFEMTVDWDDELRKLNASQGRKYMADRSSGKSKDGKEDVATWVESNARKVKSKAQEAQYQVRGSMNKNPQWQQLSRDYRFWLGLVVAVSLLSAVLNAAGRSQDLVVMTGGVEDGGLSESFAYASFLAAATAQSAGDAASQLAETGAALVFA